MSAIVTEKFRMHNAKQFKESFNETGASGSESLDSNYYLFIGKNNSYIDGDNYDVSNSVSDSVPPVPQDDVTRESYNWDSMLAAKRITESDVTFVAPRRNWTNNTTYDMYQHDVRPPSGLDTTGNPSTSGETALWTSTYFFITSEYKVYKVLDNNGGIPYDGAEPSSTSNTPFVQGGYYLKYMFTLSVNQIDKFLTTTFIPVTTDTTVSNAAVAGNIEVLRVSNQGSGYSEILGSKADGSVDGPIYYSPINGDGIGSSILSATGDGTTTQYTIPNNIASNDLISIFVNNIKVYNWSRSGTAVTFGTAPANGDTVVIKYSCAIAKIVVSGSSIQVFSSGSSTNTDIHAAGTGYTYGFIDLNNVYKDPNLVTTTNMGTGGSGGKVEPIIPPRGGHGKDAIDELGAHFVMVNAKLLQSEGDDITVANDFRQLGIMVDPFNYGTTTVATETTRRQTYAVYIGSPSSTNFIPDEQITQATTGAVGRVVEWDSVNNVLYYVQEKHPTYGTSNSSGTVNKYVAFSGANQITGASSNAQGTPSDPPDPSGGTANTVTLAGGNTITFSATGYANPELQPDSGNILYIENRRPISRAADQTEDVKITIEF